jgi:predicted 3-demethylubiquinone-9 3-methyltransferase (glyoxalase superfamily)
MKTPGPNAVSIVPHLWFDREAAEAAAFYASLLPDSRVTSVAPIPADTPSGPEGSVDVVEFTLFGQPFMAISAGPLFRFNPAISFLVNFDPLFFGSESTRDEKARRELDEVWEALAEGGKALIEIGEYPFSRRYGWIQDRYGLSWQLILTDPEGEPRPAIMPSLLFSGENCGKAEEAVDFYLEAFRDSRLGSRHRYPAGQAPDREGTVMFSDFMLEGQWFAAMDSARGPGHPFNEAVSLLVLCRTQDDLDRYWRKLSAVPEAEQCGWLKDRFGVSWQVAPTVLGDLLKSPDRDRARRVAEAMLEMKKFDIAALEAA